MGLGNPKSVAQFDGPVTKMDPFFLRVIVWCVSTIQFISELMMETYSKASGFFYKINIDRISHGQLYIYDVSIAVFSYG